MISIENIAAQAVISLKSEIGAECVALALPPRSSALEPDEIAKLDAAIERNFKINREPIYGCANVLDANGALIRTEFQEIGCKESYVPLGPIPVKLRDAILRPASSRHIVFHLTRLAAHRRDSRGSEALSAALEDIAFDLRGMSEWAVIQACRELRGKQGWYPSTGEILDAVRKHHNRLLVAFAITSPLPALQPPKTPPAPRSERPKGQWTEDDWDAHIFDAENMLSLSKENPNLLDVDYWALQVKDRKAEKLATFNAEQAE